jgi:minor extracellular serine protease Vpr
MRDSLWQNELAAIDGPAVRKYGADSMKRLFARPGVLSLLFSVPAFAVLGLCFSISTQSSEQAEIAPLSALSKMVLPGTRDLQLIIQLSSPSLVERIREQEGEAPSPGRAFQRRRMDFQSLQAQSHRTRLAEEHQEMLQQLSKVRNLRAEGTLGTVMNAVIARVPVESYSQVRKLTGIKRIYFSRPQRLLLDAAALTLNAQALWSRTGGRDNAGHGIKIGIIDTGIDITNPMFTDTTSAIPSGYPRGETAFTNHKVIVARNYLQFLAPQTVQTAVDEVGHGTFVAGAAAGKVVTAPAAMISGMAPGAFLGSYKVFGTPGVNDSTTTAAVVKAIEDAVNDGMDVINLSFGGVDYALPSEDPECLAVENAVRSGVVVTVATGNEGPSIRTISTPAATPDAIAVGSVSNSRAFYAQIHATAPAPVPANLTNIPYLPGDGPKVTSNMAATGIVDVAALQPSNSLACSSFPSGSMSGQIALVSRGGTGCYFVTKVNNAAAAGAVAVVIYNNDPSSGIPSMGGLGSTKIPAVAISNSDGLALKQFVDANPGNAKISIDNYQLLTATAVPGGVVSSFSSVGPGTDFSIKPDLLAVGENVYSAAETVSSGGVLYNPSGFALASGTSFSAPMVAGAAACLKELHPGFSALAIKSLLVNTASQNVKSGSNAASVLQMGSGMMDMGAASAAGAVFAPTSMSFGPQSYSGSLSLTKSLTITNISSTSDQYNISIDPVIAGPNIIPSRTYTGQVPPNQTATIDINLQVTAPSSGGFAGFIVVQSANTSTAYHIPYWAGLYVPDSSRVLTVSQSGGTAASSTNLTDALSAALPGNVIEIADSGTYSEEVVINTNNQGLPLHGITIRAQQGKQPILNGTGAAVPGIQIIGLRNVLLQGLTIHGGSVAALVWQPNPASPTSATIDRCTITNVAGSGRSAVGIYSEGATVNVVKSDISGSTGTGIVSDPGSYITVFDTTLKNNANNGINALFSNIDILDSNISNNVGPGLFLDSCTGTIKGNNISGNTGNYGDGAEISDGTFRIIQNIFSSNDRAGIGFFQGSDSGLGAAFIFSGNTVSSNKAYGIYAGAAQNSNFDGNMIKDNSTGVRLTGTTTAVLVNNVVTRSNSSSAGDGLQVAGNSNVRIINNTVYKNSRYGITLSSGSASVSNTIIGGNSVADLQGIQPANVSFSLTGDSTFANINNNISGSPAFANPDLDDFSLTANSPALNAGSNNASGLPFLDYYGHLRAADGTVDIGAIEANSSFPLTVPVLANGVQSIWNGGLQSAFSIYNSGNADTSAGFFPYAPTGGALGVGNATASIPIGSGAAVPILGEQLFNFNPGQNVLGSVLISGTQPMAGFYLLTDSSFQRFATTVNASDQASAELLFPYHRNDPSRYTKYILFNPGPDSASVQAQLYSSSGSLLSSNDMSIAAKGQVIFAFDNIANPSGYVHVQSDRPLTGTELLGDPEKLIALPGQISGSESRLFFPFFAVNQEYSSLMGIINPAASPANVVLTAYGQSGQQLGNSVSLLLNPNAQILETVSQLFGIAVGQVTTGYIVANGDQPGITGFIELDYSASIRSAAAVPADSVPHKKLIFSDVANQTPSGSGIPYETGLVLMNPFATAVQYTVDVYDGSGALVATMTGKLSPGEMAARMLSHPAAGSGFFTQPISLASGHIEIQSDHAVFGLETLFTDDLSIMILTPPQKTEE